MIDDLIWLLTHRECGEGAMLARWLGPEEFECHTPLPREVKQPALCTLNAGLRLMVLAALTLILLGRRSSQFFESARGLYPQTAATFPFSGVTFSAGELKFIQDRLARWPEALGAQVALALGKVRTRRAPGAAA
jgi:hypothetical protein